MAAGACPVCDLETTESVCPRCATILARGLAGCPRCGTPYTGSLAVCTSCSTEPAAQSGDHAPNRSAGTLAMVPGFDEARARILHARGLHDFADVIKLGLPDSAVRRGLHHTISRKILLASVATKKRSHVGKTTCFECHTTLLESEARCPACGSTLGPAAEAAYIERRLAEVRPAAGVLSEDPDFRSMPDDVRGEILRALGSMLEEETVTEEEFQRQVDAWREKGFDVAPVLVLLTQHPNDVRDRAIRLIRAQIRKKREGSVFRCPLCDEILAPTVEECGNCGAKFS